MVCKIEPWSLTKSDLTNFLAISDLFQRNSRQGNDLTWVRYHADDHTADADDDHDELPGLVASAGLEFESWATQAGIEI